MRFTTLGLAVTLAATVPLCATEAHAQSWSSLERALEGRELVMRPTMDGRRKVYLDVADPEAFALHRGDRLFPLRESETVRIVDATAKDDHLELELESSRLGRGRVDFYGSAPGINDFEIWLDEVFEITTPETAFYRYVGNPQSHALHLKSSNHLPERTQRELFLSANDGVSAGYRRCGVCFVSIPDVSDYETERGLAMLSLQQVRATYYPVVDTVGRDRIERLAAQVLEGWPVPLKGYRYRFEVVASEDINAFAVPTGHIFVTSGLLESLETDEEVSAILAHEIAHVESRHSYRLWRNQQKASAWLGLAAALAGATKNSVDDLVTLMSNFTANLFLAGHGRDREREADLFASFYLNEAAIGDEPLLGAFRKLKFARDAYDPFGSGGGLFASHPHIEERLSKATDTVTRSFSDSEVFYGLNRAGALVATLRFDVQRLFGSELDVVATLSTTAELGEADNVNTLEVWVAGQRLELRERTAEKIFPSDEVASVFGNDRAAGLIEGPIEQVELKLRNVDRWLRMR